MDPNSLTNLDPKLRETYERVMGTSTPAPTTPLPQAADATPAATTDIASKPATDALSTPVAPDPTNPLSPAEPMTSATPPSDGLSQPVVAESPLSQEQPQNVTINQPLPDPTAGVIINKPHGHMGLIRVFYILGAIVFFIIYMFFWIKIFNIKIPFLP